MLSIVYLRTFIIVMLVFIFLPLHAQEIITGIDFFDQVAENYTSIQDYIADIEMQIDNSTMSGQVYYKSPNLIRIDFTSPSEQVMVSDGEVIQIYIPDYNVTLIQRLRNQSNPGGFASGEGLLLLRRNYQIAFKDDPGLQAISADNPSEKVHKLFMTWRNTAQGFREIEMDITPDLFIRRMTAITTDYRRVVVTFNSFQINKGIPDTRFEYDSPPSSNNFDNFLYGGS